MNVMAGAATGSLDDLRREAASCRACPLWKNATQTVFGEGPSDAEIMLVGEQPGDREDLTGHPFVGPAGLILDRALADAGIDRARVYVTNAVKHFNLSRAASGACTSARTPAKSKCAARGGSSAKSRR